jgi:hypothetical protein
VAVLANGGDVLVGRVGEPSRASTGAFFLEFAEGGGVTIALAAEAGFLDAEVVELALVGEEDFSFDEVLADVRLFQRKGVGEFEVADGVDAEFERGYSQETPFGIGERLDQALFFVSDRLVLLEDSTARSENELWDCRKSGVNW